MYLAVRPSYHPDRLRDRDVETARAYAIAAVRQAQRPGPRGTTRYTIDLKKGETLRILNGKRA